MNKYRGVHLVKINTVLSFLNYYFYKLKEMYIQVDFQNLSKF